ncbi:DUF4307 domain-containing protein [Cutibacterium sp. WCA-380-WT-3A]|uniref:DUF4307 domain-containing protein n=1 Tax=Cutibacterium porci TaxID=2605781 RepID=A0A7K0J9T3_9ACTN|nr:DUF4307 domain-containing protein [Cutibacterium porci]MSS46731.1 DUF4307 domain-containing protein [Cutibacterium porci]
MGHVPTPSHDPSLNDAARERIANRYPKPRRAPWIILNIVLAAILIGWTVWAGLYHADQPIRASLHGYQAVSDTRVDVTINLHRPDPSVAGSCTLVATGADHVRVGETTVTFPASASKDETIHTSVKTFSRAVTAELQKCGPMR